MYSSAKKFSVGLVLLIVLGLPAFYWTVKHGLAYVGDPELYEGDCMETRACRQCGGSGKDPDLEQQVPVLGGCCPFCRGKGKVQVILPGPKRPVRVWGVVLNVRNAEDSDLLYGPRTIRSIPRPFGEESRIRGAIANATVVIRRAGEGGGSETVVTRSSGRFSQRLVPGVYAVRASAPGFEPFEGELTVEPLVEPIWLEKATLVQEPGSSDEARSLYGLHCIAALDTTGGDGGSIRLVPGGP